MNAVLNWTRRNERNQEEKKKKKEEEKSFEVGSNFSNPRRDKR